MPTYDRSTLAELVARHLGGAPADLGFRPVTTGKHNTSYWVQQGSARYVLRIAPPDDIGLLFYERRMMHQEPALHALIRARTTIPVAEVVAHDFSRAHLDQDYMLMRALPGAPLSEAGDLTPRKRARALRQVGVCLAHLHRLTAAECLGAQAYGYLGAHRPMAPQPTWAAAFREMWTRLLDDVVACGCYSETEASAFREMHEACADHFCRAVAPRLLHMDIWSQNILVDGEGNVTGLVDLDRALWGDAEIEFAVLDYCGISEPAFWEGYGQKRDTSPSAQVRRVFYLLYELQKYMPISIWRRKDPVAAERYKRQSHALARTLLRPS